ncbi:cellulose 1,4-beta-cellobiosidase [Peziza echinospora]|nr:cellulose 1,4-beta-cellobiosidase [Peziza echinospora]
MKHSLLFLAGLLAAVRGQKFGSEQTETHPSMSYSECTSSGSCTKKNGKLVIDANWRWVHNSDGYENCYDGNEWVDEYCPDSATCVKNCVLDGANYADTYGVTAGGDSLELVFITEGEYSTNIGSRLYLMADDENYMMFDLLGKEFTFDVDVSNLACGLNGALYFVSMDKQGGKGKNGNEAGAKYGTGYCDAQCPRDLKFIDGKANVDGWVPSKNDQNAGVGNMGSCCAEMDVWEANNMATAYTPHSCDTVTPSVCNGDKCGGTYSAERYDGTCDPDGCDFNSYRQGDTSFYGPGLTVDTNKKFTVVTQFVAEGGVLSDIRRIYVQDGKVIENSESTIEGIPGNSVTKAFCDAQKDVFGDIYTFEDHGGFKSMSEGMEAGMVLVMSLWDDHYANMLWLDSSYPTDGDKSKPGVARGPCPTDSGDPADVESEHPSASVTFSNIKVGPIGSTYASKLV